MEIESEFLQQFQISSFQNEEFTKQIVESKNITQFLKEIDENISKLNFVLHEHVVLHHEDLLSQAVGIGKLESILDLMLARILTLVATVSKIKVKIHEPHRALETRILHLERMLKACDALRKIIRSSNLVKRIQSQEADIVKCSLTVNELETLFSQYDWEGISMLEEHRRYTQQMREKMEEKSWNFVASSLESGNQSNLGNALQVFQNLHKLPEVLRKILESKQKRFQDQLAKTVQTNYSTLHQRPQHQRSASGGGGGVSGAASSGAVMSGPGKANLGAHFSGGQAAQMRATLWTNIDTLLATLLQCTQEVNTVAVILKKKRDFTSQQVLWHCLQSVDANRDVCVAFHMEDTAASHSSSSASLSSPCKRQHFLDACMEQLIVAFAKRAQESNDFVTQSMESEYPKLLKLCADFYKQLSQELAWGVEEEASSSSSSSTTIFSKCKHIGQFLEPFEQAYLSRSLSRLFDPVEMAFSHCNFVSAVGSSSGGGVDTPIHHTLPTVSELDAIIGVASKELAFSTVHGDLQRKIVRNIGKMLRLVNRYVENIAVMEAEASQITAPKLTDAQLWNSALLYILMHVQHKVESQLVRDLQHYTTRGGAMSVQEDVQFLLTILQEQTRQMNAVLEPLLESISEAIHAILSTMHQENFAIKMHANELPSSSKVSSLYMRELQDFIQRAKTQYLSELRIGNHLYTFLQPYVVKCVELFLLHASVIRPLNEHGTMRLAADTAELEFAISPFCIAQLSNSIDDALYQRLRQFRKLLFDSVEDIKENALLGSAVLPRSLVLNHLFSRAPNDLQSPHDSMQWSVQQYIEWMMSHPNEDDRISIIKGAVDSYASMIRRRGDKQYHSIYPAFVSIISSFNKS